MENHYDVIVVGGGTGGAVMSKFLAQRRIDVALFEKLRFEDLHKICGDATSEWHFEKVSKIDPKNKIEPPKGDEFYNYIKGFTFYSPSFESFKIPTDGDGWIIARDRFGKRLIREARDAGVKLFEETTVLKPLLDPTSNNVIGLQIKTKENEIKDISSHIVVDASGMAGIVRRQIDEDKAQWDSVIRHYDLAAAHRELVQFDNPIDEPQNIRLYFDAEACPGGYFWIFPQNEYAANVGLGVEPRRIQGGPKVAYREWEKREPKLFNGNHKVVHEGGATVPLRRPMDTLVFGGLVLIGDAGACVKSTDGGGIGLSMTSASHAVGPIVHALQERNYSRDGPLWDYNVNFMRDLGFKEAPLAIAKVTLVTATNKELTTLLGNKVVTPEDLYDLNNGDPLKMGLKSKIVRAWRGKTVIPFLLRLLNTMKRMDTARELYANYPDNWNDFLVWKQKIVKLYQDKERAIKYYTETNQPDMLEKIGISKPSTTS
ncbi:MAG: geranylgeranyl reductase family protein [Candidatus Thorarchaeota archaeon]